MPNSDRKRVLKIPFKSSDTEKNDSQESGSIPLKAKGVCNIKSAIPSFGKPNKLKQASSLPRNVSDDKLQKVRMVGGVPQKSTLNLFSDKPMKSRNVSVNKMPTHNASLLNKKVSNSGMITKDSMQKEHAAPRFLSTLMDKGILIKRKVTAQLSGRKVWSDTRESNYLSDAKRFQLFQALLKEPLPFLDLHGRFGVSKQTIRRLVKNGLLMEVWGPKSIGVRFKLSKKGKIHLKELEAAAKYESKMREKDFIRLKNKPLL
jgi:hypothetical protein